MSNESQQRTEVRTETLQTPSPQAAPNRPVDSTPKEPVHRSVLLHVKYLVERDIVAVLIALVILILFIGLQHPDFLSANSLLAVFRSASFVAIAGYGMVFLLAQREIDLSIGGVFAVSLLLAGKMIGAGMNPWLSLVAGPLFGAVIAGATAVVANLTRLPVIIVSIGTVSLLTGVATVVTDGKPLANLPLESSFFVVLGENWAGMPVSVWAAIILAAILTFVLNRTSFGMQVRAVGSNPEASRLSGISNDRIRVYSLMLMGALTGVAGVLSLGYYQGADATIGNGFNLAVIAAAIIGGTAVSGGSGSVMGALLGALVVATINSGLVFFSINANWSDVVTGLVVLVAVGSDGLLRRRRRAKAGRGAGA